LITQERQDYIKAIYQLQHEESPVRTTSIAEVLGVEPASVTGILKRLAELHLVNYARYKGVTLTEAGEKIALEVIRHHRLIELYLMQALGYSWDEVHEEAEQLEHAISEDFEDRIAEMLGEPTTDPHGAPIPTKDGQIQPLIGQRLSELQPGQAGHVRRVDDRDSNLLRYLDALGIRPGTHIRVTEVAPFGGPIHVCVGDAEHAIGSEAARQIYVEVTG
jgi:DtxR family Mn-dependent transcriptional regulator